MNKTSISILAVAVVIGGGAFYSGMKYAQSKTPQGRLSQTGLQNLSAEDRQQRLQQLGISAGGFRGGAGGNRGASGGFASGEIISKDDKNLTIKLQNGGSKIVFFSDSTEINKSVRGAANDLEIGKNVTVSGTANSDGSVTAETIQLRTSVTHNQP